MSGLQKTGFNIPFGQGLDTKTDPNQVQPGKMLELVNATFNKNQLQKRFGFPVLTALPDAMQTTLTTLNDNLIATGDSLYAYSADTNQWIDRGTVQPVQLSTQPLVRNAASQENADLAIASNGLCCLVYSENSTINYQISDSTNGQIIVPPVSLPATSVDPRVYILGSYFCITFKVTIAAVVHLQFVAVPILNPFSPVAAMDISTQVDSISAAYDAIVANNTLYISWAASDVGGAIRTAKITSTLSVSSSVIEATPDANLISVAADLSTPTPTIRVTWWAIASQDGFTMSYSATLVQTLAPQQIITNEDLLHITSIANNGELEVYYDIDNVYSYVSVNTNYSKRLVANLAGSVTSSAILARSVGLASKPFVSGGITYILTTQDSALQPTYFLVNSSGQVIAKLAYSNGGGYITSQVLPSVSTVDSVNIVPYLFNDLLASQSKEINGTEQNIYAQTGVGLARFLINNSEQYNSEIADSLQLTGGIMWQYDAVSPVELGFNLWPEDVEVTTAGAGGSITAQDYFYVFTYEWQDAQGRLHRSAPSVPFKITTTGATSTNTINVPTLRLTYKIDNPVAIVGYRWSQAQQTFYQFTSISNPTLNDTSVDSVTFTDIQADSTILGNNVLYTTGGVVENIAPPASTVQTLYRNRVVLVDAENQNSLWYSKQVIQNTPVEFSDLFTIYVAPTAGAQGSTGTIRALSAMDDKLIIFKPNAIYYLTGNGPDNTGANNDFSEPVFITATVGTINPRSIVMIPQGLMYQSNKGIWLLGRDLSTTYIGAPVEQYNDGEVVGAVTVPGTNEVRLMLSTGIMLMYDYFYAQWGVFSNNPGISTTLYQGRHTYLNNLGQIKQQSLDAYLDGTSPVLMKFSTAWLKLSDLQGYQRAYFFFFLGKYLTPHKLQIDISFDFDPSIKQSMLYEPDNYSPAYGGEAVYGGGEVYGGPSAIEKLRVFIQQQKCESVRLTVTEVYDPSKGVVAGAGFTMSGINLTVAVKKGYPVYNARNSVG